MGILKDLIDYLQKLFTWWIVIMPWEQGIRVQLGKKVKLLDAGIYAKFPLIHTIFVQERRLRVINLPIQTLSTNDNFTITMSCSVGYSINDIVKLYNTLYQPDMTIANIVSGKISTFICNNKFIDCTPKEIEKMVFKELTIPDYGLKFENVSILNYAVVKTFRLIQDGSYIYEGLEMKNKK